MQWRLHTHPATPTAAWVAVRNDGRWIEADSPAGLVAGLIGPEYAEITDEGTAWAARWAWARHLALRWPSAPIPTVRGPHEESSPHQLDPSTEDRLLRSLSRLGWIHVLVAPDLSRQPQGPGHGCGECLFFDAARRRCGQYGIPTTARDGTLCHGFWAHGRTTGDLVPWPESAS